MNSDRLRVHIGSSTRISTAIALTLLVLGVNLAYSSRVYGQTWGVDYGHPEKYLVPGEQSRISSEQTINWLKTKFGQGRGLEGLRDLYLWMRQNFAVYDGGGKTIGKVTIDGLLDTRSMSGCHDFGLVFSAVARYLGYPAVMVDAAGLTWAEQFKAGKASGYSGHVFVEVYLSSKWILVDSTTGEYVEEYQPSNPVIPIKKQEERGYLAILKGRDTWEYGIKDPSELNRQMESFARSVDLSKVSLPPYEIRSFTSTTSQTLLTSSLAQSTASSVVSPSITATTSLTSRNTILETESQLLPTQAEVGSQFLLPVMVVALLAIAVLGWISHRRKAHSTVLILGLLLPRYSVSGY